MSRINEVLRVTYKSEYYTGDWVNAIVGRIDYGDAGDARGGMAAAICAEMNMPAKAYNSIGGPCYSLDCEFNCPADFVAGDRINYPIAFMKFGLWGDASGQFDDEGYLFHVDGLEAGSGHVLSENSQTLRINIGGTDKYIYLSSTEDIFTLGGDIDISESTDATSGNVECMTLAYTNSANGINNMRAFTSDLTMGANCNGPYAGYFRVDVADATVGGLAAALGMELILSSVSGANGEAHGMTIDIACPAGSDVGTGSNKHSFIKFEIWSANQAALDNFDDHANLFFLNGMTSGAGNIVSANETTLRINIEGTSRYLMLSHAEDALDFSSTQNAAMDIDVTVPASSGNVAVFDFDVTNASAGIVNFRGLTVDLTMAYDCSGPYAAYFRTDIADATVAGLSAAMGIELVLSSVSGANGEAHGMTIDIACPEGSDVGTGSNKHSFIKFEIWSANQTALDNFDDHANLFFLNGMTSGAGNLVSANEQTLRINIEGTARYLLVSQAEDCLSLTTTATPIVIAAGSAATACIGMSGTLAGTNSRAISCVVSQPNAAHGDGYGCNEFDVTLTGTSTSHVAAVSSWINITAAGTHGGGGVYINAMSNGVYIGATPTISAARVNFGMRASYQGGQTPGALHLISYSSPGVDITSMFHIGQFHSNVGCVAAAGSSSEPSTCVKFMSDDGGNVKYIRLYDDVN